MPSGNWIDYRASSFADGSGTSLDPYRISTAAQLAYLAYLINTPDTYSTYSGKYYVLTAHIELADHYWTPIGTSTNGFTGVFNGNNRTIRNISIDSSQLDAERSIGLFGYLNNGNTSISNVKLSTLSYNTNNCYCVGSLIGYTNKYANVSLSNISVNGYVAWGGSEIYGGLIGTTDYSIVNVSDCNVNNANLTCVNAAPNIYMGGIIGYADRSLYRSDTDIAIEKCNINTSFTTSASKTYIGGVIGYQENNSNILSVTHCSVSATLHVNNSSCVCYSGGVAANTAQYSGRDLPYCHHNVINQWLYTSSLYTVDTTTNGLLFQPGTSSSTAIKSYMHDNYINTDNVNSGITSGLDNFTDGSSTYKQMSFSMQAPAMLHYYDGDAPTLTPTTYLKMFCYELGADWTTLNHEIVYMNIPFMADYPDARPYYNMQFVDWNRVMFDASMVAFITNSLNFTIPAPSQYGYSGVSMQLYTFDTKRVTGVATATGSYYTHGDMLYNINQDYRFNDIERIGEDLISYSSPSGTVVEVENLYYQNNGIIYTITDYTYK